MARVIAIETGHDGVQVRSADEEFDVADERMGKDGKPADGSTWFVGVAMAPRIKAPNPNARPPGAGPRPASRASEAS